MWLVSSPIFKPANTIKLGEGEDPWPVMEALEDELRRHLDQMGDKPFRVKVTVNQNTVHFETDTIAAARAQAERDREELTLVIIFAANHQWNQPDERTVQLTFSSEPGWSRSVRIVVQGPNRVEAEGLVNRLTTVAEARRADLLQHQKAQNAQRQEARRKWLQTTYVAPFLVGVAVTVVGGLIVYLLTR